MVWWIWAWKENSKLLSIMELSSCSKQANFYCKFPLPSRNFHISVSVERILIKVIPGARSPLYSLLLNSIWSPINPKHIPPVGGRKEGAMNMVKIVVEICVIIKVMIKNIMNIVVDTYPKDRKNHEC